MCEVEILSVAREPVWLIECDLPVPAGFPSPADDYRSERVDLNKILLPHPDCTYLARVRGDSMAGSPSHIPDGALLAVDCTLTPQHNHVVVAAVEGEFTVKRLERRGLSWWLVPDNPKYPAVDAGTYARFEVWGVVTHVVTELIHGKLHENVRARRLQ
ncbi:translesion error-prone DNA polymerase V autoproteolytic subunit [Hymenobacter busanensis]|uniref:Translesion error-prone DNA polymerase V autoproteolytic subunit n=1 Tax=Hymenobacter busanensis TaxID=2607656 RepID=A0A7L5A1G4_9BACT|nr:translesion error-prone DNA polymerase V autoproteolytic subunit [Hymenobacter busanensis]KAA9338724.1 translesion error-prone DNA polymerase V autoproteolytic subunit [Hymenobacter busanensis]QHJ08845.1 translesion error-prone DNA polymerase V autoproteolytic subunit [Hymenobacter busanensis]